MRILQSLRNWVHDRMPQTLFGRTLLIIVVPVLLLQITVTIVFFDRHWSKMTDRLAASVAGEVALATEQIDQYKGDDAAIENIRRTMVSNLDMVIDILPDHDRLMPVPDTKGFGVAPILAKAMHERVHRPFAINIYPEFKQVQVLVRIEGRHILQFTMPERRLFSSSSYIFILWMIGLSIVFFAIAIVFMRNQIRPIRRLAVAADWLGKGRDVHAFKPSGAREVRQAADAFMRMRGRIQRQIQQRTTMLAGVSHDLRTPITRLKLQLEMMGDTPDSQAMRGDLTDMERMIEGYLSFTKGEGDEASTTVDINPFFSQLRDNIIRQGKDIAFQPLDKALSITIRPQAMTRAVTNIINNGATYGDHVWLALYISQDAQNLLVVVDDDGPGIAPEMMEEVFKPFVRLDESRNTKSGGVGLGLSIAQDIVAAHGGGIELEPSQMGGLRVIISLPL